MSKASRFRHVVLLRWAQAPSAEQLEKLEKALAGLRGQIPGMHRFDFGVDLGLAEGNFDFAIVGDFADVEAYGQYATHPEHQRIISEQIRPMLAERVAVQVDLEADGD